MRPVPGQLDGDQPHAAGRAVHDQDVALAHPDQVQGPHGGLAGDHQPAGDLPRHGGRSRHPGVEHRELGQAAAGGEAEDLVADLHPRDAVADLVDHARGVDAGMRVPVTGPPISPPKIFQSAGFRPAARTAMRTCPGPACGSGTSATARTSGPPARS